MSENRNFSATEHLVDLTPVCKLKFGHCGPLTLYLSQLSWQSGTLFSCDEQLKKWRCHSVRRSVSDHFWYLYNLKKDIVWAYQMFDILVKYLQHMDQILWYITVWYWQSVMAEILRISLIYCEILMGYGCIIFQIIYVSR